MEFKMIIILQYYQICIPIYVAPIYEEWKPSKMRIF